MHVLGFALAGANIQNRAAGTFLWARPPVIAEDYPNDAVRVLDSDRRSTLISKYPRHLSLIVLSH